MASSSELIVVAFDFGTTFSGYAFSFRDDPLKVQTNNNWIAGSQRLISLKTPTCMLLDPNDEFHSFGFAAENKYISLAEDSKNEGWKLFRQFKMLLHSNESLTRDALVEDINHFKMPAMKIFAMSIKFLKEHFFEAVNKQTTGVLETDIRYVITIPAIWDDKAKHFMREAAIEAGIDPNRLQLAYEPEAASIWCEHETSDAKHALSEPGSRYMVIDLGGGTADISVHEKLPNGKLKAIHKASGGPWGGIYVDQAYQAMLNAVFGEKAVNELKNTEMGDYIDILRDFETKKREFSLNAEDKVTFRISAALREAFEKHEKRTLKEKIESLSYGSALELRGSEKLRLENQLIKSWFDVPLDQMTQHVKDILKEPNMENVANILLVGGFGESSYVQEKLASELMNKRLIVPKEAGLVVLKGAVRFGHNPGLVSSRILQYTYGFKGRVRYDSKQHSESDLVIVHGEKRVRNAFIVLARAGDEVYFGDEKTVGRKAGSDGQEYTDYTIMRTMKQHPVLATEPGCCKIGRLRVHHPEGKTQNDNGMDVTFMFGDTELKVKVTVDKTGATFNQTIDCLQ